MGCCCSEPEEHKEYTKDQVGPMEKRSCHDIVFLILFVAFWVGMFYIAGKAVANGNPKRFLYGVDYYGNVCGEDNIKMGFVLPSKAMDFTNEKYLYFMPSDDDPRQRGYIDVCVAKCPNATHVIPTSTDEVICPYNTTASLEPPCYGTLESRSLLHRCVPFGDEIANTTKELAAGVYDDLNLSQVQDAALEIFGTLTRAWKYIACAAAGALVLSFVWLFLMSRFAGVLVYLTIVASHIVIAILAYFVYHEMKRMETDYDSTPVYLRLVSQENTVKGLKGIFIALVVVLVVCFLAVLCLWARIGIAIGIIKEASQAMIRIPTILLVPLGVGAAIIPLAVYWFYIGAYLATTGKPEYDANGDFQGYKTDRAWVRLQLYHVFGGFWALNFLHAVGECVIAGAIASYYWVHDKSDVPRFPVASSLYRVIRYHLGSLMFGSLILAFVQFIRFLLNQLERQVKGKENEMVKCVLKITECLLACFEKFIKFLNKNAYIMISIYGYSFCTGARRGFSLIAGNLLRVTALNCVSAFVIFLGKLFVSILTTLIAFVILKNNFDDVGEYYIPTIAIAILSYAIAVCFFSVFDMAVDTLLLCFCEDCDRNNGSDRPYYMSDSLKAHISHDFKGCGCCC